jgi:hypothetical protein
MKKKPIPKELIETIARILGEVIGPIDGGSGWTPTYDPQWPKDYTREEIAKFREAARAVLAVVRFRY